jgi:hypothetical protein
VIHPSSVAVSREHSRANADAPDSCYLLSGVGAALVGTTHYLHDLGCWYFLIAVVLTAHRPVSLSRIQDNGRRSGSPG